jgi:nitrogenase molybdenum-iron protein alpha chain
MVHISHGPVGCGQYSWAARRNYYVGTTGVDSFVTMQFTSDFQEKDIVFGGDKKLSKIIDEVQELFPLNKGISIQSECPIGLIGDDIEAVSKRKAKEYNKTIVPVRCEGFRGVSQSLGHHIANDAIRDWVFDKLGDKPARFESTPYDVAIIGTTTSEATPGRRAFFWRRWACASLPSGRATELSPSLRPRRGQS